MFGPGDMFLMMHESEIGILQVCSIHRNTCQVLVFCPSMQLDYERIPTYSVRRNRQPRLDPDIVLQRSFPSFRPFKKRMGGRGHNYSVAEVSLSKLHPEMAKQLRTWMLSRRGRL